MPSVTRLRQSKHHLVLLSRLLHQLATLIVVVAFVACSIYHDDRAFGADIRTRPNVILILADDKYVSQNMDLLMSRDLRYYSAFIRRTGLPPIARNFARFGRNNYTLLHQRMVWHTR